MIDKMPDLPLGCERKSTVVDGGVEVHYIEKVGLRNLGGSQTFVFVHEIGGTLRFNLQKYQMRWLGVMYKS